MNAHRTGTPAYEFGEFRFEPSNARLLRRGELVRLEPKALRILQLLVEHHGALVERDVLFDQIWGRVVVTPGTLTRLVAELRRALGDDASKPRYIGTVHTRGYRWLAPLAETGQGAPRSSLPERLITLVGRDQDLANLERLVSSVRLATLAGPGGTGKTQLALEFGRRREQRRTQPVVWADLTTAIDGTSCGRLVVAAVEADERGDTALERSVALVIGQREFLLILDNCERVVRSVAALAKALLTSCPRLTIICTSQVTLDIPEETLYWVLPLALPVPNWQNSADPAGALLQAHAVQLFIERARAIVPEFALDAVNGPIVAEICRRLDGLPLALELAAARLAALAPTQLLAALDDRFAILARQVSTPDSRHRSLQGAIEWSYGLLEAAEQTLLDLLGVFAGSWSLEAAQAVAAEDCLGRIDLINGIQTLVQRSLVTVERDRHESRYRLLDSVGAFARSRLGSSGREANARKRHAEYFTHIATTADGQLLKAEQLWWLEYLKLEWTNLVAAYEWARSSNTHRALAAKLAAGLRWCFWLQGRFGEGMHWYREPQELIECLAVENRAQLLNGLAIALFHGTHFEEAARVAEEAASCARACSQDWECAYALGLQGWAAGATGKTQELERLVAAAHQAATVSNDPWLRGFADMSLAWHAMHRRDHPDAVARLTELTDVFASCPDRQMHGFASIQQALQLFIIGERARAQNVLRPTLRLFKELRSARGQTGCCELAAYLVSANGDHEVAARLLGAAMTGRETTGAPLFLQWHGPHEMTIGVAREALGAPLFDHIVREGQRIALPEAVELVSGLLENLCGAE